MRGKLRDKRTAAKRDAFKFKRDSRDSTERHRPLKQDTRGKVWQVNEDDEFEEEEGEEEEEEVEETVNASPTK